MGERVDAALRRYGEGQLVGLEQLRVFSPERHPLSDSLISTSVFARKVRPNPSIGHSRPQNGNPRRGGPQNGYHRR